jgi:HK97 gp10 family phage protein
MGKLKLNMGEVNSKREEVVARIMRRAAEIAKEIVPVDTGALRDSISAGPDYLAADMPYASFVEYGTEKMDAQPFMTPAINQAIAEVRAAYRSTKTPKKGRK